MYSSLATFITSSFPPSISLSLSLKSLTSFTILCLPPAFTLLVSHLLLLKCPCVPECHQQPLCFRTSTLKNCIHSYVFSFNYLHFDKSQIYSASLDFSPDFLSNYSRIMSNIVVPNKMYNFPQTYFSSLTPNTK